MPEHHLRVRTVRRIGNHVALLMALLVGCLLSGCTNSTELSAAEPVASTSPEAEASELGPPLYPNKQLYTRDHSVGGMVGSTSGVTTSGKLSTRYQDEEHAIPYALEYTFQGTFDGKDRYLLKLSYPVGKAKGSSTLTIDYEGKPIEFWRDETWCMGMRPPEE
ncbi:MAG: hypothetical protein ACI8QC_001864 [Planctomycetota bacterium]|jgi:hypothetical protein